MLYLLMNRSGAPAISVTGSAIRTNSLLALLVKSMGTCVQTERHLFSFDEENEEELGGEDERGYTSEGN